MQVKQLKRVSRGGSDKEGGDVLKADLELLSVYSTNIGRSRITEDEAIHLRSLRLIKDALEKFSLSKNESRVYLFLARFGARKAQKIAEALGVHRTEAYKILHRLENQGLVSCVFERPMKFVAVPFEKALESFIEERRQRVHQLERRKSELLDVWYSLPKPDEKRTRNETFQVLEGRRQISVKANELLKMCGRELLMVVPDGNLLWLYNSPFFEDLEQMTRKKQLDVRIMTNYSPTSTYVLEKINVGDGDFAYLVGEAPSFIIVDGDQILLLMERKGEIDGKTFAIWTNYESLVNAFNLLFALLWKKELTAPLIQLAKTKK